MKFYYFNSTHWDREWYEPMQKFRRHLVDTTAVLLDAMEREGGLRKFTFDGQTIVLEDVTEIHPEWRERLTRQIAAGRLNVGPWYVQPDELLISGESLIRNLQFGRETARAFGATEAWPVGYLCDMFGHVAQMPQILAGFGIAQAVLWRGVDGEFPPFFRWQSPDGTVCDTVRLYSRFGYAEFSIFVLGLWQNAPDEAAFKRDFQQYVADVQPYFGENILLSDALDHIMPRVELERIFGWIRDLYPEAEIIHTDYREMRVLFHDRLPVFTGELIRTADKPDHYGRLLTNCLSARYDLKSANDRLQNRLELLAGPVQAAAGLHGDTASYPYWKLAWKRLVTNHAHDSICGCAVDTVHRRMLQDFEEIGHLCSIFEEDLIYADRAACTGVPIAREADNCELARLSTAEPDADGNYRVRLYNALPFERRETVDFEIAFPAAAAAYPAMGGELNLLQPFFQFNLFDETGAPVPFSVNAVRCNQVRRFYRHDSRTYHIYHVSAPLTLRASGWTTLTARPSAAPVRQLRDMFVAPLTVENEVLRLTVHPDATFDVLDRRSGRSYGGFNDYVLDRDIGDGWLFARGQGTAETAAASGGQVAVTERSPFRTTFLLTREYRVPRSLEYSGTLNFAFDQVAESAEMTTLRIQTHLTIEQGSEQLKIRTVIDNNVEDCRLRLRMPTFAGNEYFVYQNYAFLTRPVGRRSGFASENWTEAEPLEKNFSGIAGKRDSRGGIALLSACGLHEVAATEMAGGEFYFTLYRAFGRTVRDNGGVDGQLQKRLTFEYAYSFFPPERDESALFHQMQQLRSRPVTHTVALDKGDEPSPRSAVVLEGNVGYGSFAPAFAEPGAATLRLINFANEPRPVRLTFGETVDVALCELDETGERPLANASRVTSFTMNPGKIATLLIRPKKPAFPKRERE